MKMKDEQLYKAAVYAADLRMEGYRLADSVTIAGWRTFPTAFELYWNRRVLRQYTEEILRRRTTILECPSTPLFYGAAGFERKCALQRRLPVVR
jgi:hypothetical protein